MVLCATISPLTRRVVPHVDESLHSRRFFSPRRLTGASCTSSTLWTSRRQWSAARASKWRSSIRHASWTTTVSDSTESSRPMSTQSPNRRGSYSSRSGSGWSSSFSTFPRLVGRAQVGQFADAVIGELELTIQAEPEKLVQ